MALSAFTKLFRQYRMPDDKITVHTQILAGKDHVTITLSPAEQKMVLSGIRQGMMYTHPNVSGNEKNAEQLEKHINYRVFLSKMEAAIEQVGIKEEPLPGKPYEGSL